jgi:hypothetical protein
MLAPDPVARALPTCETSTAQAPARADTDAPTDATPVHLAQTVGFSTGCDVLAPEGMLIPNPPAQDGVSPNLTPEVSSALSVPSSWR